jgi:hydrogenase-1 operon protein HyaF
MKAGFWMAPDGADQPIAMIPIGRGEERSVNPLAFLATTDAEALIARCPGVAALLPKLVAALETQTADGAGVLFDLGDLAAEERRLIGEVLGEGEVAATVALPGGVVAQAQESVMAGLWRVRFTDAAGDLVADYAEVSAIPQAVRRAAAMTRPDLDFGPPPDGAMNVMPVLAEVRERMALHRPGQPSHAITFSLFPMTPEDVAFLQETLGHGPVRIVSRGYGTCRVQATAVRDVWAVQFFNAMDTILLDTIEIGDVPVVACAAEEDFRDSAERLREIEEAYFR